VIDNQTEPWGIKVTTVEIKDVEIPERMQHAIARQAEAERERRAKIINSEGEFQAAARLRDAADVIGENPIALQLRYLQTLREIGGSQNSTIVFPMPVDMVGSMVQALAKGGSGETEGAGTDAAQALPAPTEGAEPSQIGSGSESHGAESDSRRAQIDAATERGLGWSNGLGDGSTGEPVPNSTPEPAARPGPEAAASPAPEAAARPAPESAAELAPEAAAEPTRPAE
jgi:hypothetical protein